MKRSIDQIYRDRFENLETTPPQESWEIITAALPKKSKKRIFPFWYKLAGAAAVLALLISLYNISLPQANNESSGEVTVETKRKALYSDPVSENFQETMRHSSTLLEKLKIETWKDIIENSSFATPERTSQNSNLASITEVESEPVEPFINSNFPVSTNSLLSGIERQGEKPEDHSKLTDDVEIDKSLNKIELLVQSDSEKEKEDDKIVAEKTNLKRLSIRPTAGAVYFDNLGDGNSLDPAFANNKSSGEFTMAFGVNIAYKINSKWNIRTGISKVNLSHNTSNIEFGAAIASSGLDFEISSPPLGSTPHGPTSPGPTSPLVPTDAGIGDLNHALEYIEIPLEFELSLLDKKMGLNIIGGASTFFLDGNLISHNSPFAKTELGEANNLNDISFSANIGLGLNYNFSREFQFNLEPILKYQINTYSSGSGLTPYIFGIYSGFSFKF